MSPQLQQIQFEVPGWGALAVNQLPAMINDLLGLVPTCPSSVGCSLLRVYDGSLRGVNISRHICGLRTEAPRGWIKECIVQLWFHGAECCCDAGSKHLSQTLQVRQAGQICRIRDANRRKLLSATLAFNLASVLYRARHQAISEACSRMTPQGSVHTHLYIYICICICICTYVRCVYIDLFV